MLAGCAVIRSQFALAATWNGGVVRSALNPQGSAARRIEDLWWILFGLGTFVAIFVGVVLWMAVRRNSGTQSPIERRDDHTGSSRHWILGAGVIGPAIIIVIVFVVTVRTMYAESQRPDADALIVDVTGHQWWWEVSYPDLAVSTANEVHIPAGVDVEIHLRSADVIHSFWVPALAGKRDALPERTNTLTIDADHPGTYAGRCAEFCGIQHANMDFVVVAHDAASFEAWIDARRAPAANPDSEIGAAGAELFVARGCGSCHAVDGLATGGDEPAPDLTHLASRRAIAGGLLASTGPDLRTWIADPHAVKPGVLMPDVALTDTELDALVAYLESLR